MEENTVIKIHEISREVLSAPLSKFSNNETKKDLVSLVEDLRDIQSPTYLEIKDINNYTGFIKQDDTVLYYNKGKKIFSRLDESLGVERGIISFSAGNQRVGDCRLVFDYRGGCDNRFNFEGDENNPVNKIKYSTSNDVIIFNPKRNASHLFGDFDLNEGHMGSWKFFEQGKDEGSFFLANHIKKIYLNLRYGGIFGSKNISEFNEIQKNLQKFETFEDVKYFFEDKKVDIATMTGKYLKRGIKFSDIFDGKIEYA